MGRELVVRPREALPSPVDKGVHNTGSQFSTLHHNQIYVMLCFFLSLWFAFHFVHGVFQREVFNFGEVQFVSLFSYG